MPWPWIMAGALLAPAPAPAPAELPQQPKSQLSITWSAPAGCPGVEVVRAQAQARLSGRAEPVVAEATVTGSDAEGWRLTMRIEGPHGTDERQVQASACVELAEAAGLFLAVAADPQAGEEAAEPEPEPPPVEPPLVEPEEPEPAAPSPPVEPEPEPPPVEPPPAPRRVRGLVRLEGFGQFLRLLPEAVGGGLGGAVGIHLPQPRVRLEARAHYVFAQRATYTDERIGGDIDLWVTTAAACFEPAWSTVSLPLCSGLSLGAMRADAFGVTDPGSARSLYVGLPLGAAVRWSPWRGLALWVGPRATVSLRQPGFHVRDLPSLFRAGPAALWGVAGIEYRFP